MVLIVKLIAIAIIIYGCIVVLRPRVKKVVIEYIKQDNRIYIANGVKTAVGIFMLIAASSCRVPWVILVIGGLAALSGIALFLVKKNVINDIIAWIESRHMKQVRIIGAVIIAVGALIAIAA